MSQLKAQMLDFKPLSVRQIFKLFSRVEAYLSAHYKRDEIASVGFYLSTSTRTCIIEEILDVYLGYLYDRDLKTQLIQELVHTIWNISCTEAVLDP